MWTEACNYHLSYSLYFNISVHVVRAVWFHLGSHRAFNVHISCCVCVEFKWVIQIVLIITLIEWQKRQVFFLIVSYLSALLVSLWFLVLLLL